MAVLTVVLDLGTKDQRLETDREFQDDLELEVKRLNTGQPVLSTISFLRVRLVFGLKDPDHPLLVNPTESSSQMFKSREESK